MSEKNWFSSNRVDVKITLGGNPTMVLPMREILSDEEIEARTRYFGLTQAEQKEKAHEYNVDLMCALLEDVPLNLLPGFPAMDTKNFKSEIKGFLTVPVGEDKVIARKKKDFVNYVMSLYWRQAQPQELF